MGFLSVMRRWALRDKMPIREIARRTGLSRDTIKKYLREGAVEQRFKTPSRPSKLDPYADRLSVWLLAQTRKSRKERRTVKLMYEDLVKLGYDGFYERVAAFARAWRTTRAPILISFSCSMVRDQPAIDSIAKPPINIRQAAQQCPYVGVLADLTSGWA